MTRREVVDYLQAVETQYPVDELVVGEIHIWPLIKIEAFFAWFYASQKATAEPAQERKGAWKMYVSSSLAWLKFYLCGPSKVKYIFSGAYSHRVLHAGKAYNRYFDPMMDFLEENGHESLLVEQGKIRSDNKYYKMQRVFEVIRLYRLAAILSGVRPRASDVSTSRQAMLCIQKIVDGIPGISVELLRSRVNSQLRAINSWTFVFDRIFDRCRPEFVFGLCYYSSIMYAMNISAHKRKIPSVDMQHGTQGPLHVAYNNFSKVPDGGYETLPKYFWCWDTNSARPIAEWVSRQKVHYVLIGGNPWLTLWDSETQSRKNVLFTLQPIEPIVPDLIIDAVRQTYKTYNWVFRLHPRQDIEDVKQFLIEAQIENITTLMDSHSFPLPKAIIESLVHISRFSGAIIESAMMGIPTVTIDELGVHAFSTEIEEGTVHAFSGTNAAEFIEFLEGVIHSSTRRKLIDFKPILRTLIHQEGAPGSGSTI